METTRRQFIATTAGLSLAALAGSPAALAARLARPFAAAPLKILILGGTGFLGPAVIDAAKARGHSVTTFNRGRREKYVGSRDGVEKLYGNRDPQKHAGFKVVDGKEVDDESTPKGLKELEGKKWDAVIDTSGQIPRHVRASAELLAPHCGQYLYTSSISAYKDNDKANADETAETAVLSDPTVETMGAQFENYGGLKRLCEQAVEAAFKERATNIRPGYIVGPGDTTDRFTYWPVRVSRGGAILCPGKATDPVQFVDVRDLAEWMIHCAETKASGYFNATGPASVYTNGQLLAACEKVAPSPKEPRKLVWADYPELEKHGVGPGSLPILLPCEGEMAGFHTRSVAKAVAAGLKFRSAEATCKDLLDWWPKAVELRAKVAKEQAADFEKQGRPLPKMPPADQLRAGIPAEKEAEILKALAEAAPGK